MGFRGIRIQSSGFRFQVSGFRVQSSEFRVSEFLGYREAEHVGEL